MRYFKIDKYDATNWEGINTTIFFTGCTFGCPGCFNKDIQDFNVGTIFTEDTVDEFIRYAKSPHVTGVCILGGEPFQQNLVLLYDFLKRVKHEVNKPIHMWTGYDYEVLLSWEGSTRVLEQIDTLVDGLFMQELKDLNLKYRGSSNQRVIDVKKSLMMKTTVEMLVDEIK